MLIIYCNDYGTHCRYVMWSIRELMEPGCRSVTAQWPCSGEVSHTALGRGILHPPSTSPTDHWQRSAHACIRCKGAKQRGGMRQRGRENRGEGSRKLRLPSRETRGPYTQGKGYRSTVSTYPIDHESTSHRNPPITIPSRHCPRHHSEGPSPPEWSRGWVFWASVVSLLQ